MSFLYFLVGGMVAMVSFPPKADFTPGLLVGMIIVTMLWPFFVAYILWHTFVRN